ncbi:hypothetical protein BGZ70_006953, partial [Mortierella alpina]
MRSNLLVAKNSRQNAQVACLLNEPAAPGQSTHNYFLHDKLIDCRHVGIFDSKPTEELQNAYEDYDCDNKLGLFQLLVNAQNVIAVLPDED